MNGWVLIDLGAQIEMVYGPARLIVFYVLTSIAGFMLSRVVVVTAPVQSRLALRRRFSALSVR